MATPKKNDGSEQQFAWESSPLIRLKERLQFTGWLQYFPNAALALICFLLSALARLAGLVSLHLFANFFLTLGSILLLILAFDVMTVKLQIRLPERLPNRPSRTLSAFDIMRHRRSCRSFQTRRLTEPDRTELLEFVRSQSLPSSRLGDEQVRFEYVSAPLTVWPAVVPNGEFLVAIAPRRYSRTAVIDVGRCLQKVVLQATRMGVATCWIGPGANHDSVIAQLGPKRFDTEKDHIICVCAVGYKSAYCPLSLRIMTRFASNSRLPLATLFYYEGEQSREPLDVARAPFDEFGRCFEACQYSPSSYNAQTTRCVAVIRKDEIRFDFYSANPRSRYYAAVAVGIWLADWEEGVRELGIDGSFVILSEKERSQNTVGERGEGSPPPTKPLLSAIPDGNCMQYDISWVKR